jgi:DNA-directed RNA polymerase III subunit RPC7
MYGRDQANALYGVRNRASQDPFTAMPTYDQEQLRLARSERALPDWSARPVCRELFPAELLDVVDPPDRHSSKRRRLELSSVSALPNAEEAFGMPALNGHDDTDADAPPAFDADGRPIPSAGREKLLLNKLDAIGRDDAADDDELADDDGNMDDEDQDEVYDDEDAGDYDAENYFDGGDDDGEDYGDDGDGEGTY